jgi:dTDP-4-dehydrorhamnose reductase
MMDRVRTVLVVGGTGFIGRHLVPLLTIRAERVIAPARRELDITDVPSVRSLLRDVRPQVVVNCAAASGVAASEATPASAARLNRDAVGDLAGMCAGGGARLVHFSTDQVFGGDSPRPYREDDAAAPVSVYGATKHAGDVAVLAHEAHLVVRTGIVFGAGGGTFMSRIPDLLMTTGRVRVVAGMRGSCAHVARLCEYVSMLIERGARGLYHVANAGEMTWDAFADACALELRRLGRLDAGGDVERVDYDAMRAALGPRARYSVLDVSKFERFTGGTAAPWTTEIAAFVRGCVAAAATR